MAKDRPLEGIPKGTVLGTAPCPNCGFPTLVKVDSAAHAYAYCIQPDGGCGHACQSKGRGATIGNLRRIETWKDGGKGKAEAALGESIQPGKPAPTPKPKPAPVDPTPPDAGRVDPTAAAAAAVEKDWFDE